MLKNLLKKNEKRIFLIIIIILFFVAGSILINKNSNLNPAENKDIKIESPGLSASAVSNIDNSFLNKEIKEESSVDLVGTSINPYYYGVGEKGLNISQISQLTKDYKNNIPSLTVSVSPVDQVWYFAYPESYPVIRSIKDQNGFDLISDFKVIEGNEITNSSGEKIKYRIYEYENVTTLSSYKVTYLQ